MNKCGNFESFGSIVIILVVLLALCFLDKDAMRIGSDVLLH